MTDIATAAKDYVKAQEKAGLDTYFALPEYKELQEAIAEDDEIPNDARLNGKTSTCECPRCGKGEPLPLPIAIDALAPWVQYFRLQHRWCKPRQSPPPDNQQRI